ncbi:polysaccharide deacetylase family protein [Sciscionella marina]|uniref:polysaccharide deacetylase family protein n=1 Tax=Sciscionella marina TaxID=508770 RepID=UPI00039F5EC7|nr:polysaccharide deacetylase family protein [Sciscionella marina]
MLDRVGCRRPRAGAAIAVAVLCGVLAAGCSGSSPGPDPQGRPVPSMSEPVIPPPKTLLSSSTSTEHKGGKWAALTFDDGPNGNYTHEVLEVLKKYHVKATFCMIGKQAAGQPAVVGEVAAAGMRLCDHTLDHDERLPGKKLTAIDHEIVGGADAISRAAGPNTHVFYYRAPGGKWNQTIRRVAAGHDLRSLAWTVDTADWKRPGVSVILAKVRRELKPGGVILMHDGGGNRAQTIAALRQLIPKLLAEGWHFDFPSRTAV